MLLLGLYYAFLVIFVIMVIQLAIIFIMMYQLKRLQEKVNHIVPEMKEAITVLPIEDIPDKGNPKEPLPAIFGKPVETTKQTIESQENDEVQKTMEPQKNYKEKVLEAIQNRSKVVCEEDLPRVQDELMRSFAQFALSDYHKDLDSKDYFRFIDLRKQPTSRVVVIGDIHCDYISLSALLLKLSVSEYDYFKDAYFVFLGDYLDRGNALFEPLLLLMDLKRILGDRMIMLKGNHESIEWDEENQKIKPRVKPHESCDCLNNYCGNDKKFLKAFADFYRTLPIYVYLKTTNKNILLTHAAVPRDIFINMIKFDESNGAMVFSAEVPWDEQLSKRNKIFKDMIWGDPSPYEEKIQVEGRFEFGRKQFDRWVSKNHIGLLLRSHEEARLGYEAMFDERLYILFSTGCQKNPQTGYPNVEPALGIVRNNSFDIENSFLYRIRETDGSLVYVNLLTKQQFTEKQIEPYKIGDEFFCDKAKGKIIREIFKKLCLDETQQQKSD